MNVLCTGNPYKDDFLKIFNSLSSFFKDSKNDFYADLNLKDFIKNNKIQYDSLYKPKNRIDFVISLGGDGSMLKAVSSMKSNQIPLLGIHIGQLGFLNQVSRDNYLQSLKKILILDKIEIKKHFLLNAKIYNKSKLIHKLSSLNDFAINQIKYSRLLKMDVSVNNTLLNRYNCDGLIVSSPLGSTAYSLSAGGPIVSQDVKSMIITPVSPHSLSARPIVIDSKSIINITFPDLLNSIGIYSDGQSYQLIKSEYSIKIMQSKIYAKLIIFKGIDSYYKKLRTKLMWFGNHRH